MKTTYIAVVSARSLALALLVGLAGWRAGAAVLDDFESYAVGSNLHGQGGWAGWAGNPGAGALVSTSFAFSPTRAVVSTGATDLVRPFSGVTNGQWVFQVMQYIPATSSGTNYVILLNRYQPPFTTNELNWSVQIQNNLDAGQIISDLGAGASRPMVKNQWVEIRVEVNLASNTVAEFYNGQLLSTHAWQDGSGLNELQALDLFADNSGPVYYDNVSLAPAPKPAPALRISNTGPNLEGLPPFKLEWDAISNATYLVQSADSLAPGTVWHTLDAVIVPDKAGSYQIQVVATDSTGQMSPTKFFRLILPQPEIFSVEPAVFAPGVAVDAYLVGQCFEITDVVRVDGVPLSGVIYLSHNMLQGPLPTLSVGRHLVELVRGGVVRSSFTVTCADPLISPELVLQGPPTEPPASPHAKITKSRSNIQNNRLGGWGDQDDDGDGTLDYPPDVSGQKITKSRSNIQNNRIRVDSWASIVEISTVRDTYADIDLRSGEVSVQTIDLAIPGRGLDFIWARSYNSRIGRSTAPNGWTFSYDVHLQPLGGDILIHDGTGRADIFKLQANGVYTCPEFFSEGTLSNNVFKLVFADTGYWEFKPLTASADAGKLAKIVDCNGNTMSLEYDGAGKLTQVVDDLDRTNTVAYDSSGRIASVIDFSGRTARYEYDTNGDLVSVISPPVIGTPTGNDFPGGKTNSYTYSSGYLDDRENHLLLSVIDATGQTIYQHVYQHNQTNFDFLRCISVQRWTNTPTMISYLPQTPTPAIQFATLRCIVNDPVGNVTEYFYDARNRPVKMQELTGRATPGVAVTATVNRPTGKLRSSDPDVYETRWSWNNDSLCTQETLPGGEKLQCIYESDFDKSTRARKRADCRVVREIASEPVDVDGDGVADLTERKWQFEYDPRFGSGRPRDFQGSIHLVESLAGSFASRSIHNGTKWEKVDNSELDVHANSKRLRSGVIAEVGAGRPATVGKGRAPNKAPNITHEYHRFATSITDPRGNVTKANYDAKGNLIEIEREYGRNNVVLENLTPTEFTVHNSHGQLTAITNASDANGYRRVDTFAWSQGQMTECVVDAAVGGLALAASFEYDPCGNVTRIVGPRGHDTLYTYNALNQLVRYQSPTNLTSRCTTDFTYDANNNRVESATELRDENDAFVRMIVTRGTFDVLDRPVSVVNQVSAGQFVTNKFFYDANDNVVAVYSPLAVSGADPHAITQIAYDERGLPFQTIAAPGSTIQSTTQYDYDAKGNVTRVSKGLEGTPRITTLEYDGFVGFGSASSQSQERQARFQEAVRTENVSARLGSDVSSLQFEHGDMDRPIVLGSVWGSQLAKGNTSIGAAYAGINRLSKITDPMGNVTTFNYDANDNLKVIRHFGQLNDGPGTNGNIRLAESRWKYDGLDRPTESRTAFFHPATQAPIGDGASVTTFAYAPNGQCTNVTDDLGRATTLAYDTTGRHISTTSAGAKTVTAVFRDAAGNVTRSTHTDTSDLGGPPQVFSRTNVYDSLNRLVSTTDNVGNTENWHFDSASRVVRATDPKGNVRWASYDELGRQTLALGDLNSDSVPDLVVVGAYDANSRLISTTDANTNTTFYAYDSLDRQVLTTSPDGTAHVFVWNANSDLVREQDANSTVITNSYDLLGRGIRRDITPGPGIAATTTFETFAYNGLSQLVAATNDVSHSEFDYDSHGNSWGNHADGWNVLSAYDSVGNRVSLTYPSGRIVTYAYDALNQVTNVSSTASAMTAPTTLASYAYEGPGRAGRIIRANGANTRILWNGLVSPPNAASDFGRGQVSSINHQVSGGGAVIDRRITAYDRNQNKTLRAQTTPFYVGGPMTTNLFTFDALNRMTDIARSSGSTDDYVQTYVLDGNGNRQTVFSNSVPQSYVMDATIPPADFQMDQYTITPFGAQQFDENGNRIAKNSTVAQLQYQHDFANRLVAVNDLTTGFILPVASYSYNALGQRISKTVYPPAPALPVTTEYIDYPAGEVCDDSNTDSGDGCRTLETREGGVLIDSFIHNPDDGQIVASASGAGALRYYHTDDLGNVLALTDTLGNVVERYDYADFGMPIFLTSNGTPIATNASPVGNPYLFHGKRWDGETGLYFTSSFEKGWPCRWEAGDFDPETASAIRGKVKVVKIDISGRVVGGGNNPWSDGRKMIPITVPDITGAQRNKVKGCWIGLDAAGSAPRFSRIPAGFVTKKTFGQLAGKK